MSMRGATTRRSGWKPEGSEREIASGVDTRTSFPSGEACGCRHPHEVFRGRGIRTRLRKHIPPPLYVRSYMNDSVYPTSGTVRSRECMASRRLLQGSLHELFSQALFLLNFCHFLAWINWIASAPALHSHDPTQYSYTGLKAGFHGGKVPPAGM